MKNIKRIRDSRFEALRIMCMFMIVISHFALRGNWVGKRLFKPMTIVHFLSLDALGPAGAVCFFIITGYFANNKSQNLNLQIKKYNRKVFNVWGEMFFYSAIIASLLFILGYDNMSIVKLIKDFFPFIFNEYWFVTCYILLLVSKPYLDILLSNIDERQLLRLIGVLFILQVPALLANPMINEFLLAVLGYLTGATISHLDDEKLSKIKSKYLFGCCLVIYTLDLLSIYFMAFLGFPYEHAAHFTTYILAYLLAVFLFLIFLKLPSFHNKFINYVAGSVFAVYIITEQNNFRDLLWHNVLNVGRFQNHSLVFWGFFTSLFLFSVCVLIDSCRRVLIKNAKRFLKI